MKRLLLGPALALPLILGFCHLRTAPEIPQLPKVPEVVREIPLDDFKQFPPVKLPDATLAPVKKPKVKRHDVRPAPARRPHVAPLVAPPAPEALPPQQGPICIFPLSMIPNCTPQVAGQ